MKYFRCLTMSIMACVMVFLCFANSAAASFSIEPQADVVGGLSDEVIFELFFTSPDVSGGPVIVGWELDFFFDSSELTFDKATYENSFEDVDPSGPTITGDNLYNPTFNFSGFTFAQDAKTHLATYTFNITGLDPLDSQIDFRLESQIGVNGRGLTDVSGLSFHQYDDASGANVVNPVPIPGAVWLLGPGLIGLAGLRKKL